MTFSLSKNIYDINDLDTILSLNTDIKFIKTNKKIEYGNIPLSFDIETTSFMRNGEDKIAIMYAWVIGINGRCIIGRTWNDAIKTIKKISEFYGLNDSKRLIIYVHNLAFEFQFIRKWFNWEKVFSLDVRKPIYALTYGLGIEFRCSYTLSGYSLNVVAKNLTKYKIEKMVGDLDYSLIRHNKTNLTTKELGYILNDGLIVMAYIQEEIEYNKDITRIPLTKTGVVREFVRKQVFYSGSHKKNIDKFINYRALMKTLSLKSVAEYKQLKRAFQGGFTHANAFASDKIIEDVYSFDFTSSYPYVMVTEQFPMGRAEVIKIKSKEDFYFNLKYYCCLFDVTFENIESITNVEHPLSFSHSLIKGNYELDNGRVIRADNLTTTITEQDFMIYQKFYKWDKMHISHFRRYKKRYLPTDFVRSILELYRDKTQLKGVNGKEVEYNKSKEKVNSLYGMSVTDICRDDIIYDDSLIKDEWSSSTPDYKKTIEKYNNSVKRFLFYGWGIWVTAYARRNLFTGIYELQEDYCYSDTDSVKFINYANHKNYFDDYNSKVIKKLKRAMKYHGLSFDLCSPKTIKGESKTLGVWDFDGHYKYFKTLGAKRYMIVRDDDSISLTVSGLNKKMTIPYLQQKYKGSTPQETNINILNAFKDGLYIPSEYIDENTKEIKSGTGKQTHTYLDEEQKGTIIDYKGVSGDYYEKSSIHLTGADYELSLSNDYFNYLMDIKEYYK